MTTKKSRLGKWKEIIKATKWKVKKWAIIWLTALTLSGAMTGCGNTNTKQEQETNKSVDPKEMLDGISKKNYLDYFVDMGEWIYYYDAQSHWYVQISEKFAGKEPTTGQEFTVAISQFRKEHKDLKIVSIVPDVGVINGGSVSSTATAWYTIVTEKIPSDIMQN